MVAEQYLGVPVKCGRCGGSFTTRAGSTAPPLRLDIAAVSMPQVRAGAEERWLTQHLVYWNLDERHELAVLLSAGSAELTAAAEALVPLVATFLNGASQDVAAAVERLAAVCKSRCAVAVIWDGQVSISGGELRFYQKSTGRLTRLQRGSMRLSLGDWLILAGTGSRPREDDIIAAGSALVLAEKLVQHGSDTVVVVRCY